MGILETFTVTKRSIDNVYLISTLLIRIGVVKDK